MLKHHEKQDFSFPEDDFDPYLRGVCGGTRRSSSSPSARAASPPMRVRFSSSWASCSRSAGRCRRRFRIARRRIERRLREMTTEIVPILVICGGWKGRKQMSAGKKRKRRIWRCMQTNRGTFKMRSYHENNADSCSSNNNVKHGYAVNLAHTHDRMLVRLGWRWRWRWRRR
jgi:hypothetical protein